jgi:hypothetical protein
VGSGRGGGRKTDLDALAVQSALDERTTKVSELWRGRQNQRRGSARGERKGTHEISIREGDVDALVQVKAERDVGAKLGLGVEGVVESGVVDLSRTGRGQLSLEEGRENEKRLTKKPSELSNAESTSRSVSVSKAT